MCCCRHPCPTAGRASGPIQHTLPDWTTYTMPESASQTYGYTATEHCAKVGGVGHTGMLCTAALLCPYISAWAQVHDKSLAATSTAHKQARNSALHCTGLCTHQHSSSRASGCIQAQLHQRPRQLRVQKQRGYCPSHVSMA